MEITLQYFDDCPNWKLTDTHLSRLISERGIDASMSYQLIDSPEAAAQHSFRGSPTVLIDGIDPFSDTDTPIGLSCRIYHTEAGPAGSPTLHQLQTAITAAQESA